MFIWTASVAFTTVSVEVFLGRLWTDVFPKFQGHLSSTFLHYLKLLRGSVRSTYSIHGYKSYPFKYNTFLHVCLHWVHCWSHSNLYVKVHIFRISILHCSHLKKASPRASKSRWWDTLVCIAADTCGLAVSACAVTSYAWMDNLIHKWTFPMLADTMVLEISSAFVCTIATNVAVNPTILSC